jgi:hypothetical protein
MHTKEPELPALQVEITNKETNKHSNKELHGAESLRRQQFLS